MSASPYGYPNADFHLSHLHRHPTAYMPHAMHMNQVMPQHIHHPYQIEMYAPTMPMSGPIDHNMAAQPPPHLMYSSQPLGVPVSTQPNFSLPLGSGGLGIGSVGLVAEPHPPIPEEASANPPPPHNRRSFFQSLRGSVSSGSNENLPPIETYLPSELVCDSEDEITSVSVENDLIPGLHGSFGSPMISFNDSRALWDSSSPSSSPVPAHRQELSGRSLSPLRPHPKAATSTTPLAEPWEVDLSFSQGSSHQASSSSDSQQSPLSSPRSSKDVGSGSTTKKSTSSDDLSRQNKTSATSSTPSTVPKLTISPADSSETTVLDPSPRRREKLTSPRRRSPRSPRYDAPETRFTSIEQCVGQITSLCKDQRGCRFLQKKLDEKDPNAPTLIFNEVFDKIVELMTDPFGNYLCQKLLEHCNEQQCLAIIELVSKHIVQISKNLHGTRAIQKMIEFLSSEAQIALVVRALAPNVVTLIKDLNGNHVIQRCLHRLSSTDNQFLFDAVAKSCVEVATHRHGCCVFQRCLDHASESQRLILIQQIARHGYVLVRDPYGNYVVQYVLDLKGFDDIKIMLTNAFKTHMVELSSQKFSSNVIEKCLSACPREVKYWMVEELMESNALNSLLRDPFGNYVIQTALTVSGDEQHYRLVEAIRPHLPSLRNTSYGKRIQNKILRDGSSKA